MVRMIQVSGESPPPPPRSLMPITAVRSCEWMSVSAPSVLRQWEGLFSGQNSRHAVQSAQHVSSSAWCTTNVDIYREAAALWYPAPLSVYIICGRSCFCCRHHWCFQPARSLMITCFSLVFCRRAPHWSCSVACLTTDSQWCLEKVDQKDFYSNYRQYIQELCVWCPASLRSN